VKVKLKKDVDEHTKKVLESAKRTAEEIASWPAWKRGESVIDRASTLQDVQVHLGAASYGGALDAVLALVDRYFKADERVRGLNTAGHRWARQGGPGNQTDRDVWENALAERDTAEEALRTVLAVRNAK